MYSRANVSINFSERCHETKPALKRCISSGVGGMARILWAEAAMPLWKGP